jgi:hypothetical protein
MANFEEQLAKQIQEQLGFNAPVTQYKGAPSAATKKYYSYHEGTDYGTNAGTPIKPNFQGKVLKNYMDNTGYGARTVIQNPTTGQTYTLSHLSGYALPEGSTFSPGTTVAMTGGVPGSWGSGNTTGQHLDVVLGNGSGNQTFSSTLKNVMQSIQQASPQALINKVKQMYGNRAIAVAKGSNANQNLQALQKKYGGKIVRVTV